MMKQPTNYMENIMARMSKFIDHYWDENCVMPTCQEISDGIGISKGCTVRRGLVFLADRGEIRVMKRSNYSMYIPAKALKIISEAQEQNG